MKSSTLSARDEILTGVRTALRHGPTEPAPPVPPTARVPARVPGGAYDEIAMLLDEIGKLGGQARRLGVSGLAAALADLVRVETIRKAVLWQTPELQALGVGEMLAAIGVEVVSPRADKDALAECDLGVTDADLVLPETGTLVLRVSPERPRVVSLLPRVHLALVRPASLRADMTEVFEEMRVEPNFVLVTGPSRTADIEMTVTVGVHGPQTLCVWALEQG